MMHDVVDRQVRQRQTGSAPFEKEEESMATRVSISKLFVVSDGRQGSGGGGVAISGNKDVNACDKGGSLCSFVSCKRSQ